MGFDVAESESDSLWPEAMATLKKNKDKLWEAEVLRLSGEIALMEKESSATKAEALFDRALAVSCCACSGVSTGR